MADSSISGLLPAAAAVVELDPGVDTAVQATVTGTFVGTITFQILRNGTEGWVTAPLVYTGAGVGSTATLTAPGTRFIGTAGVLGLRAAMTAYTSGTAEVTFAGTPGINPAAAAGGGGGAMTVADGADVALGTTTDVGIITNIAGTVIGFLRGLVMQSITLLSRWPASLGSTTAANSLPVTLSTDGTFATLEGPVNETAPATDTASSGLNGRLQRIAQRLTSMIAQLPAALGTTTAANSLPVTLASDGTFATLEGPVNETAPATDTASSGLNGRLQRIAQRLTSLIALLPAALVNGALVHTGDTAHGATDAGNPVEIGFGAIAHGANPTPVAAGQRTRGYANRAGIPFVMAGHPNVLTFAVQYTAAQTNTAVITNSAGTKLVVTKVSVKTANSNTPDVSCRIGFGTTVPAYGNAQLLGTSPGIAPGSGFTEGNGSGILGIGADADPVSFTCSVPTGGAVDVLVTYYPVPS